MERRVFVAVLAAAVLSATRVLAQGGRPPGRSAPRWGAQVEKEFRLGRGLGPQLMTEEEWKEHHEKMRTMSPEEREKYRNEMHEKMAARAKTKGLTMPPAPRAPARRPAS